MTATDTVSAPSRLQQLRELSVVVADTGDYDAIVRLRPVDCALSKQCGARFHAYAGMLALCPASSRFQTRH